MNDSARRTDRELFEAVSAGDAQALAELARRHARGLYDFALRGTLDEQQAAAVVEAAIDRVRRPGAEIPSQIDFRTWLYSLGLIDILSISNEARTARISTEDERFYQRTTDVDIELARWAWQAARGLQTRDYCVLELTLRRGLTPEEVAEAASLTRSNLYGSIGRARGAFEESFAATVLFNRGRDACPGLSEILESSPGDTLRPAVRHQIIEHADTCVACRTTLDSLPPAASLFVSLADMAMPEALGRRILTSIGYGAPLEQSAQRPGPRTEAPLTRAASLAAGAAAVDAARRPDGEPRTEPPATNGEEPRVRPEGPARPAPGAVATVERPRTRATQPSARDGGDGGGGFGSRVAAIVSGRQPVLWTYVLLGVAAVLAVYLGIAFASSIQGGGEGSGAVPLDSAARSGITGRVIDCGAPLEMDDGTSTVVSFDESALDGYQIRTISYVPVSEDAAFEDLEGTLENPFLIRLTAAAQDGQPRTEEFELNIEWEREDGEAGSVCPLLIHVGS